MKNLFHLTILVFVLTNLNAQIPSNCTMPDELKDNYNRDIKHIALQRIIEQNSTYIDSIDIPYIYQDTIWNSLAAVFNVANIPERDSTFDIYCIHDVSVNSPFYNYIYLEVGVDLSYSWTSNWQNLNIITGIPSLDTLLLTYGFSVEYFTSILGYNYATLTTDQIINRQPVIDSINTFNGVTYCTSLPYEMDGNRITYNKIGNDKTFMFELAWGDCPSGCMCRHSYNFKVYDNCSVEYLGTSHSCFSYPFPNPTNCNITTKVENKSFSHFNAYPNPVTKFINIDAKCSSKIEYKIIK